MARNNPLNKNCSDAQIALLVFYRLVSDQDLKNNGDQIRQGLWSAVNASKYGIPSVLTSFLQNNNIQNLCKTGLCITIDNQDTLNRVEKYVSDIFNKYPNSNPDNHRIGKLGEQAVCKVINDLHKFNLSRSSYKPVHENYVAKKTEEEQAKISKLAKKCKVPSNYEYDVLSQPVFRISDSGDGGFDFSMEFAAGYKAQVKTTRISQNSKLNSVTWEISDKEIKINKLFIFVICLEEWQPNTYMVVGFLPREGAQQLPTSIYNSSKRVVKLSHLLHPSGCVEYLDHLQDEYISSGKNMGHENSSQALEWSTLYNTLDEKYSEVEVKSDQFSSRRYNSQHDINLLKANAKFQQGKYQEAVVGYIASLEARIKDFNQKGDFETGALLQNNDIRQGEEKFARRMLLQGILAIIENIIICYKKLEQWDKVIEYLEKGLEFIKNNEKLIQYYFNLVHLYNHINDQDNKKKYAKLLAEKIRPILNSTPKKIIKFTSFTPVKFNIDLEESIEKLNGHLEFLLW